MRIIDCSKLIENFDFEYNKKIVILSFKSWNEIIIQMNDLVYVQFVDDMIFHISYAT